jgi:hypothetical protein
MGTSHLVRGPWTLCGRPGAPSDPADDRAPVCQICASIGRDHYGIGELAGLGLTVRQIHHWCDRGWLRFTWTISGRRVFAPEEFAVARRAVALIKGGYRTERACELARSSQD